jgi:hypothetical protein
MQPSGFIPTSGTDGGSAGWVRKVQDVIKFRRSHWCELMRGARANGTCRPFSAKSADRRLGSSAGRAENSDSLSALSAEICQSMLDSDLAALYAVTVKSLLQGVRRNRKRFPADFMFQLTNQEVADLRSQIVTSSLSRTYGGRRYRPWVFTEQGVAMLSSVLRSDTAVRVNIQIMRAFVRLRRAAIVSGQVMALVEDLSWSLAPPLIFHPRFIATRRPSLVAPALMPHRLSLPLR